MLMRGWEDAAHAWRANWPLIELNHCEYTVMTEVY